MTSIGFLFLDFSETFVEMEAALLLVPLRVVADPLVADPLLAEQHRAGRVPREDVRNVARPYVVPEHGRALLRKHGYSGVRPHRGATCVNN